jgi:putative ABC transport system substrate-binding protein
MAADLARRQVTVIVSGGGAAFAAKAATTTIPVVFTSGDDPVKSGLVSSLSRPDGNVTGISSFVVPIASKRFDFLRQLTSSTLVGVLVNRINPASRSDLAEVERAAQIQAQQLLVLDASNERDIETAFATLKDRRAGALFVCNDTLFTLSREQIVTLAARYAVPTIYIQREYTEIGGLISYGIDFRDVYRQLGIYTGRILNGAKPADLPILLPTKFELIINLKTAKTLNLDIPPNLLALADEVIE